MADQTQPSRRPAQSSTAQEVAGKIASVDILTRRGIEAMIVGPLFRAFSDGFGYEDALKIARQVVEDMAQEQGAKLAESLGSRSLNQFCAAIEMWSSGGALEIEMVEQTEDRLFFNVNRCRYAEMYEALGMRELGMILSCSRDFALIRGFNHRVSLKRTQTIMEGGPYCDFRLTIAH